MNIACPDIHKADAEGLGQRGRPRSVLNPARAFYPFPSIANTHASEILERKVHVLKTGYLPSLGLDQP